MNEWRFKNNGDEIISRGWTTACFMEEPFPIITMKEGLVIFMTQHRINRRDSKVSWAIKKSFFNSCRVKRFSFFSRTYKQALGSTAVSVQ